ncbi:Gfo/Idh/MocA family oxidoreductase [Chitinophaga pendula]|uniref:Gfo/Idh/MocA family protein n=1 Tax=Chitinophaga TaxID=79328 RepID=UPI000BAEA045|nr:MULTISPECIES: Gfo/Idh/MocA family oxidoreductase [Chitinophaga]ASZ13365.1 oxidoreductase [Chitinophaga sp. MD30]UCJ09014.1 Gfo/Idh/MocA family oxidoreductase [Chitinophaga pendula]
MRMPLLLPVLTGLLISLSVIHIPAAGADVVKPLRVAVAGIAHGHSGWILSRQNKGDIALVGIYEPDTALAGRSAARYHLDRKLFYTDLGAMLDAVKPSAVLAFGPVNAHLAAVEACAPRGIDVMVEKPLAASLSQALRMDSLARTYKIRLLTNYETSWYPSVAKTMQLVQDSLYAGTVRKVVIHDGHQGPVEIGCGPEFLAWLTDPVGNGGGALMDFGCYGANLMTQLMKGEVPLSVEAVTRQFKPKIYPKVEDDAVIIVNYRTAQCVIQASWNWPFSRKDMEVYGDKGYVLAPDKQTLVLRTAEKSPPQVRQVTAADIPVYEDPFAYLAAVIGGKEQMGAYGLYTLSNNLIVMRILEAAKESAKSGQPVHLQ